MLDTEYGYPLSFYYGNEEITFYRLETRSPSAKVLIKVSPAQKVTASAPLDTSDDAVIEAVKKRARWIYAQLETFKKQQKHVTPRQYISGESHFYLGRRHMLKIFEHPSQKQSVKLLRGQFEISVRKKNTDTIKTLLDEWYRERAKIVFKERMEAMREQTLWVPEKPPLKLLQMQTQWGNCSIKGVITLNPSLVKAPRECIDYVILHELCHIAEHNHSEQFYRLMNQVMPGWQKIKERLDQMANFIL